MCGAAGIDPDIRHNVRMDSDLADLVATGLGCGLVPASQPLPEAVRMIELPDFRLERVTVFATVSGRKRSAATEALSRAIRARGWS
jgi:DNA-binding transcriptional LysR family regulator